MKRIVVKVGVRKNSFNFCLQELCYVSNRFDFVFLRYYEASDVGIVKYAAPYHFPNKALRVKNLKGDVFYYHPGHMKWYKNLSKNLLDLYFDWLKPKKGLDINLSPEFAHSQAGGLYE